MAMYCLKDTTSVSNTKTHPADYNDFRAVLSLKEYVCRATGAAVRTALSNPQITKMHEE
jgi:hypothetical protein